jgi:predicted dehydrogenase
MHISVVGVGYWGPNLVRNFLSHPKIESVTCVDISRKRLDQVQRQFPSIAVSTDFEQVLRDPALQAVAIATPVETHFDLAARAIKAGKHVFVEKPMTRTVAESQGLVDLAKTHNRVLMVDHTFLFTSAIQKVKEVAVKGELGQVLYFDSVRINLGLFQSDVNVIWDLAPHDLSIMLHLLDEVPTAVQATGMAHFKEGMENTAYLTVFFEEKLLASFHLSWLSPVKVRRIILGGDRRMIVFDDMESNEKVKIYDKGVETLAGDTSGYDTRVQYRIGDIHVPALENKEALAGELSHFLDCIENGQKPLCDGESGLWVVKILEAAQASLESGQRVRL